MLTIWENREKPIFIDIKFFFSQFSRKVSTLDYMLLHNSNINVAIAVILVYMKCLYNVQELREDYSRCTGIV